MYVYNVMDILVVSWIMFVLTMFILFHFENKLITIVGFKFFEIDICFYNFTFRFFCMHAPCFTKKSVLQFKKQNKKSSQEQTILASSMMQMYVEL